MPVLAQVASGLVVVQPGRLLVGKLDFLCFVINDAQPLFVFAIVLQPLAPVSAAPKRKDGSHGLSLFHRARGCEPREDRVGHQLGPQVRTESRARSISNSTFTLVPTFF